jgi:hypothetical protein
MPITTTLCIVGAASISAFPLFSGFVSKSMVMVAVLDEGHPVVWLALLFASAGVFHHAGIKIPFFAFFAHDSGIRTTEPPLNMLIAMGIAAILCVFIGSYPWLLYSLLPFEVNYVPFDRSHVLAQFQLLVFSAAAFTWLKISGIYPPELHSTNIDAEWFYRRLARTGDKPTDSPRGPRGKSPIKPLRIDICRMKLWRINARNLEPRKSSSRKHQQLKLSKHVRAVEWHVVHFKRQ